MRKWYQTFLGFMVVIREDGDQYTAECVETGTATCADTFDGVVAGIQDAVITHIGALWDLGEKERAQVLEWVKMSNEG
jgi:phosphatidylserine synthase